MCIDQIQDWTAWVALVVPDLNHVSPKPLQEDGEAAEKKGPAKNEAKQAGHWSRR